MLASRILPGVLQQFLRRRRDDQDTVEHDPGALDEREEGAAEDRGPSGGEEALAHGEQAAGGGAGGDGVPGVFLLAGVDEGAVEGGEEAAPDGEAAAEARREHARGRGAPGEAVAIGGVVQALEEVEGGAAHGAHSERGADVVDDAVRAGLPRRLRSGHLLRSLRRSLAAGETLRGRRRRGWRDRDARRAGGGEGRE